MKAKAFRVEYQTYWCTTPREAAEAFARHLFTKGLWLSGDLSLKVYEEYSSEVFATITILGEGFGI